MYGYQYDDLNRLLKGNYRKLDYSVTGNYDETLSYDKHGNITSLQRNGFADADFGTSVEIDNLVYAYDGNQLLAVQDMSNSLNGFRDNVNNGTPDYGYDAYGNMTSDANKRIEDIDYNHLNLPTVINFQNNSGRIRYTYDALGVKLRKEVDGINGTTTTDYLDGFQYKNEVLSFFPTSEGYVEFKEPSRFFYVYNYTDHLGNVRMSYTDNGTAVPKILEENHYYPFGLKHENYASEKFNIVKEPNGDLYVIQPTERREWQYKYNGKEWQDELGLNFYDYGARNYDAAIGRWMNVDPLAEKYSYQSPYNFAENKVIAYVELEGLEGLHHTHVDRQGRKSHTIEKNVVILTQNHKPVPAGASKREIKQIERQNNRISASNAARIDRITGDLNQYYSPSEPLQNTNGETVSFKFNITIKGVDDATGKSGVDGKGLQQFAVANGLQSDKNAGDGTLLTVPAAVFTTDSPSGRFGSAVGNIIADVASDAPSGTDSHEMIHAFGLPDNDYNSGGIRNSPPALPLNSEVDQIINLSYPCN